ncbi:MAG: hypothetical protein Q9213_007792, partial [Squamulea squamosa]
RNVASMKGKFDTSDIETIFKWSIQPETLGFDKKLTKRNEARQNRHPKKLVKSSSTLTVIMPTVDLQESKDQVGALLDTLLLAEGLYSGKALVVGPNKAPLYLVDLVRDAMPQDPTAAKANSPTGMDQEDPSAFSR